MGKVTIVDVAKSANVSISSVSRYLANPQNINQIAAVRIAKSIEELHYVPNSSARNLKRGTTRMIGFVQPDITQELFNKAMKAMNEIFFQNDYLLITCDTDNNPEKELKHINALIEQNVAGIIISPCSYKSDATVNALENCNNFVYMDRLPEVFAPASCVTEDNYDKSVMMADAAISSSHKNYMVLAGTRYSYVTKERVRGVMAAFHQHGILLEESDVIYNLNASGESISIIAKRLKSGYDNIIFTNPKIITALYTAARKSCLKINQDISIAGFTYESSLSQYDFDFPCVVQHPYELGLTAGDLILRKIRKKDSQPKKIVVPCEFRHS